MLTLRPFSQERGAGRLCLTGVQPLSLSLRTKSLPLLYSHTCLTPWSVFQDGEKKTILSASRAHVTGLRPPKHTSASVNTPPGSHLAHRHLCPADLMLTCNSLQCPGCKPPEKYTPLQHSFPSLPFQQFQVLFNSLFKVLCIFPSRYLFAIGLPPIFSLRWNLPPNSSCNPKQLDSQNTPTTAHSTQAHTGVSPSQLPCSKGLCSGLWQSACLQTTIRCNLFCAQIHMVGSSRFSRPY